MGEQAGYSRTWLGGPLRRLEGLDSPVRREKNAALRNVINDQIQGGAAEIFKMGMVKLLKGKLPEMELLIPVHDEIVVQVKNEVPVEEAARNLKKNMEINLGDLGFYPVEVSVGPNWAKCKEMEIN